MPKGTPVERMYTGLKKHGFSEGSAARIAQARTGKSLATGKTPKSHTEPEIIRGRAKAAPKMKGTGKGLMGR